MSEESSNFGRSYSRNFCDIPQWCFAKGKTENKRMVKLKKPFVETTIFVDPERFKKLSDDEIEEVYLHKLNSGKKDNETFII